MQKRSLSRITVRRKPSDASRGWLIAGMLALPVALGRGGIKANKREGDGGTPRGNFRLRRLWWRADKHPRPVTSLPVRRITAGDGWCEDPADRRYNQRGEEYNRRRSHLQTLARDRLAIGIVEHRKLLVWKDGYGIRHRDHCAQVLNRKSVEQKKC